MKKDKTWIWQQPLSEEIFRQKYCLHGEKTAEEVFRGVADEIASVEATPEARIAWADVFYGELISGRLQPAGRILANARPNSPVKNYNNCFTIDIEDDLESIYESLREDAVISKMGGGVGFDASKLRPKGAKLSAGGESSGVLSFLRIFDQSAKTIMTGGQRRSAHIALLDISHPEVESFITAKRGDENKELTQFNISVKVTDAFIEAVKNDADWDLAYRGAVAKTVKARDLWDLLAKNAFIHNEPGIFNADTVERFNNGWWAFKMDRVNPCGELVMPAYSLCCLSSVNLAAFVASPSGDPFADSYFDFDAFRKTVAVGVRFLDNTLDATAYPLKKIEDFSRQWRRIGLGFTGLADAMAMLDLTYGSDESLAFAERLAEALRDATYGASSDLAAEKGSFPAFDADKYLEGNFIKTLPPELREKIRKQGMRNVQLNTVAPTGTTSLSVGQNCSSGIEPIFARSFRRTVRTGVADETRTEEVYDYAWKLWLDSGRSADGEEALRRFVTTADIDPYRSIDMQAVFQKYVDHSISKTLNLAPGTPFEEYKNLFMYAYEKGLKGFTTFNPEGSMKGILEYSEKKDQGLKRRVAPPRPKDLPCDVWRTGAGKRSYLVIPGFLDGSLYELFVIDDPERGIGLGIEENGPPKKAVARKVESGRYDLMLGDEAVLEDFTKAFDSPDASLARLVSMALRHGTPLQFIVSQLQKDTNFTDVERSIARVLKNYIRDGEEVATSDGACPECGEGLSFRDGCVTCPSCGYSKCS